MTQRTIRRAAGSAFVLLGILGPLAPRVNAATPTKTTTTTTKNNNNNTPAKTVNIPAVDTKSQETARANLVAGRAALAKAEAAFNQLVSRLQAAFDSSGQMSGALASLKSAEEGYQSAMTSVRTSLSGNFDYKSAVDAKKTADKKIAALREEATPDQEQMTTLATEVLKDGGVITKIETDAAAADPTASAAKARLTAAAQEVAKLRQAFNESMKGNPEWASARKSLDEMKTKLSADEAAFTAAEAKLASSQAAHNAAVAQQAALDKQAAANKNNNKNNTTKTTTTTYTPGT